MTSLPEIFDLFTKLASHLHCNSFPGQCPESEPFTLPISSLNKSLNRDRTPVSASRVLDTALSLMCFKAPEVFDSSIQYLSETIIAVLYSSVSCRVLRFPKEELLQVGSLISCGDCTDLIQACADVIQSLEGYGRFSHKLLHAVLKVATSASCTQGMFPLPCIGYENSSCKRKAAVLKLHSFLPEETSAVASEAPLSREALTVEDKVADDHGSFIHMDKGESVMLLQTVLLHGYNGAAVVPAFNGGSSRGLKSYGCQRICKGLQLCLE